LVRDYLDKFSGPKRIVRRILAIIGYLVSFIFIAVLLFGGWRLSVRAFQLNQMAPTTFDLPLIYVYPSIVIGSVLMLLTLIFIILDIFAGGEEFL